MIEGLVPLPFWGYVIVILVLNHITIVAVTIFLHRHQAHRALELHPVASHFFRFWLWVTTSMVTKEWVAIHRKHHARVETEDDPHSPQILGLSKVVWWGAELYRKEYLEKPETLKIYGKGTPDDWLERYLYGRGFFTYFGIFFYMAVCLVLFGALGLTVWAVQMVWIPFFGAGIVNGVGHWWGYRNYLCADASTNIVPIGIIIGGEELHNNHHAFVNSAKFSIKPWEFDLGWFYIQILATFGLADVKRVATQPFLNPKNRDIDRDTVKAVVANRLHVVSEYAKKVMNRVYKEEFNAGVEQTQVLLKPIKGLLARPDNLMNEDQRRTLELALAHSSTLEMVYQFKLRLQAIWNERSATPDGMIDALKEWCRQAELSGIKALQEFAENLRGYSKYPA